MWVEPILIHLWLSPFQIKSWWDFDTSHIFFNSIRSWAFASSTFKLFLSYSSVTIKPRYSSNHAIRPFNREYYWSFSKNNWFLQNILCADQIVPKNSDRRYFFSIIQTISTQAQSQFSRVLSILLSVAKKNRIEREDWTWGELIKFHMSH